MQNITEILKANGVEVTEEQQKAINKAVNENYKTVAEFDKKVGNLETERDGLKEQLDAANETLKGFEGVDVDGMKAKLKEHEENMKQMEEKHKQELYNRDFADVLDASIGEYKFTSDYAKKSIVEEIKAAGLKLIDGKIIGLNDLMATIKEKDASAFVDEEKQNLENNKAKFTKSLNNGGKTKGHYTMSDLMKMKNENPDMDISQYLGKGE